MKSFVLARDLAVVADRSGSGAEVAPGRANYKSSIILCTRTRPLRCRANEKENTYGIKAPHFQVSSGGIRRVSVEIG
jgi:hypothetical protein